MLFQKTAGDLRHSLLSFYDAYERKRHRIKINFIKEKIKYDLPLTVYSTDDKISAVFRMETEGNQWTVY